MTSHGPRPEIFDHVQWWFEISLHLLKFFGFSNSYAQLLKCMEHALGQKNLNLYDSKNSMASVFMCIEPHCVRASCTALAARARTDTCSEKLDCQFEAWVEWVWFGGAASPNGELLCLLLARLYPVSKNISHFQSVPSYFVHFVHSVHFIHFVHSVHSLLIHDSKRQPLKCQSWTNKKQSSGRWVCSYTGKPFYSPAPVTPLAVDHTRAAPASMLFEPTCCPGTWVRHGPTSWLGGGSVALSSWQHREVPNQASRPDRTSEVQWQQCKLAQGFNLSWWESLIQKETWL